MAPLVSVIVRTMGRPQLARALDTVAAQTHRPLEIVLVDAADRGLEMTRHSGVPVRVVRKGRLARAPAANAGLEAAQGEWLIFLDEDDEIEPTHVAHLLATAQRANAAVAYSQTRVMDTQGKQQRLLGGPYDRESLFRSNFLAIHSVLFTRALVAAGHRFDASLAIFEDWDFWLQLSGRAPFAFSGAATAIYHAASGESGAGAGPNVDPAAVTAAREQLMRKYPPPLVSVIVRTMGRPELSRALDTVAAQSYRPIEIVLVDAADRGVEMTRHSGIPVRVVRKGKLGRPHAANAGLDAAGGDWLLFLDEDDEIERTHVEQLLAAARRANAGVAYSQTQLVDAEGRLQRLLGGPYNREFLFRSNYLAIHAVLFSRALAAAGHRFDESLPMFEDWDFWLQLSQRTPFAFTGFPTAIYRAASGESGAGSGANLDREAVLANREKLMKKWADPT